MFDFFNKNKMKLPEEKAEKHDNKIEGTKKTIIHSIEELKEIKTEESSKQEPKPSFNNINYELPNISIIDNEKIKKTLKNNKSNEIIIPLGFGDNDYYYETLESMPNLIVGGTVMSGKSSFIHTIIGTILLCKKPDETKLIICDSKMIEYNQYNHH